MDFTHSSRYAWQTIKKLDPESRPTKSAPLTSQDETPEEIKDSGKHTPIRVLKSRPGKSIKQSWLLKKPRAFFLSAPITCKEMEKAIKCMKKTTRLQVLTGSIRTW
ncbi:hypothetical protein ElyMa_005917700 [Elysia marginata]|uniref:Uncharacterized protein n=1 Tax=Elysia marginata TaxID=1093978 RepID=A0AAV4G6M5_9GAST|nr:hypothetical protein ElyMa_005917700 [Elysia marginata]